MGIGPMDAFRHGFLLRYPNLQLRATSSRRLVEAFLRFRVCRVEDSGRSVGLRRG